MLIDKLVERQKALGLPDGAFAHELGISRPLWCRTRKGELPIGLAIAKGAYKRFPDLIPDLLIFLGSEVQILT